MRRPDRLELVAGRSSSEPGRPPLPPWSLRAGAARRRLRSFRRRGCRERYVHGSRVAVPAGIGIDAGEHFIAPIHTHDGTGVIHVESPEARTFSLGQFFGVWGVRLTPCCLGGYRATDARRLRVFVDGRLVRGDPRRVVLGEHEEIVVTFGTRAQLPRPIPRSYAFPPGL